MSKRFICLCTITLISALNTWTVWQWFPWNVYTNLQIRKAHTIEENTVKKFCASSISSLTYLVISICEQNNKVKLKPLENIINNWNVIGFM